MIDLKNPLFRFGVWVSGIWLLAGAAVLWRASSLNETSIKPNEWGDIFAGLAAPMAFLWLVLGFIQQGQELKLSTDALKLQAEELKNAVEQHRQLVAVSRDQVEASLKRDQEQRRARRLSSQPRFSLSQSTISASATQLRYVVRFRNAGPQATNIHLHVEGISCDRERVAVLGTDDEVLLILTRHIDRTDPVIFRLGYIDLDGYQQSTEFAGHYSGNGLSFEMARPPMIA